MKNFIKFTLTSLACLLMVVGLQAQNEHPKAEAKASPAKEASGMIDGAKITIKYSSPGVKGRTIWGELVPFNEVWRAGANEATTVKTDKDLMVEGQPLPAGTYAFFVIPRENGASTVIFNKEVEQWGSFKYDESKDALRLDVEPSENTMTERLEYSVEDDGIVLAWENYKLHIDVEAK